MIVKLMSHGAHDIVSLPEFNSLLHWVIDRAMNYFNLKNNIIDRSTEEDFPFRVTAFFDALLERKNKGIPITENEIKLFFPDHIDTKKSLDDVLHFINAPQKEAYKNVNVLIADDEPNIRIMLDTMLEPYGYTLFEAKNGQEVLDTLSIQPMDILLLDVALGDLTGNEIVPILTEKYPDMDIIMITAFHDLDLIVTTIKNGAKDYIIKGNQQHLLPQKMAYLLQKKQFSRLVASHLQDKDKA